MLLMQDGGRCVHKSVYQIMGLTCIPPERRFKKLTSKSTYSATTAATLQHNKWKCWTSILKASHSSDNKAAAQKGGKALLLLSQWRMWAPEQLIKWNKGRGDGSCVWSRKEKRWRTLSWQYQHFPCFWFQQEREWVQAEKGKDADDSKIGSDLNSTVNFCCALGRSSHATDSLFACTGVLWLSEVSFLIPPKFYTFLTFSCILHSVNWIFSK